MLFWEQETGMLFQKLYVRKNAVTLLQADGIPLLHIKMCIRDRVCAACDTYPVPGFQGVTPLEYKCDQCGECYLNLTGGICPITARCV